MQIYETHLTKTSQVPAPLEFLQAAYRRGLLKTSKEIRLYRNLELGNQGEQYALGMLQTYGRKHWVVVRNLWLEHFGIYENDIVLLTNGAFYVLEVKNYEGHFEYKKGRCFINGKKLKENCIQQAEKALMNLQEICGKVDRSIRVKGALLFVGEHNEVQIVSEVDGIEVVTRSTFRQFIQRIAEEEDFHAYAAAAAHKTLAHFEKKEVLNPFGPLTSYSPDEVFAGRRGIYCQTCGSYHTELTRKFVGCEQGHVELRGEAVLRTIEEFRILTFQQGYASRAELMIFLDETVSESYLARLLNRYFDRMNSGRYSKYKLQPLRD